MKQADALSSRLEKALLKASNQGEYHILCETSPCLARMKKTIDKRLTMMDPIEFAGTFLVDRLDVKKLPRKVALHPIV